LTPNESGSTPNESPKIPEPEQPLRDFFCERYSLGLVLEVRTTDREVFDATRRVLGSPFSSQRSLRLVVTITFDPEGCLARFSSPDGAPIDFSVDDLILANDSPDFPFRLIESNDGWTRLAWKGDDEPALSLRGWECRLRLRDGWRLAIALLILNRIYLLRSDAIFFHAATIDIGGSGVMFIGPKGFGKSTTAMALAARGHALLGDETACYVPATGMLQPFRRPVGIKPGIRARAVDTALRERGLQVPADALRIDFESVLTTPAPHAVPLRAIVLLEGFAARPELVAGAGDRGVLARLQPTASSLVSAPRTQRVFELARMVSSAQIFHLKPADPDETAALIESRLGGKL